MRILDIILIIGLTLLFYTNGLVGDINGYKFAKEPNHITWERLSESKQAIVNDKNQLEIVEASPAVTTGK